MIRVAVIGASGRMGRLVLDVLSDFAGMTLTAAVVSPSNLAIDAPVPLFANVRFGSDVKAAVASSDVVIDFSHPNASVAVALACAAAGMPCLIATTGHSDEQRLLIDEAASAAAILIAPNTSVGVFVTTQMVELAAKRLGESFTIEVNEVHHVGKRDAPSGTAKSLAAAIAVAAPNCDINITSVRTGDVVGEHTVRFVGRDESIEVTHRATDRRLFARGALRLAEKLVGQSPGLKRLADFF